MPLKRLLRGLKSLAEVTEYSSLTRFLAENTTFRRYAQAVHQVIMHYPQYVKHVAATSKAHKLIPWNAIKRRINKK